MQRRRPALLLLIGALSLLAARDGRTQPQPQRSPPAPGAQPRAAGQPSATVPGPQASPPAPGARVPLARRLTTSYSATLANGCRYALDVDGSVIPLATPTSLELSPDLSVSASVNCPAAATLRSNDDTVFTSAVTPSQLVSLLAQRATVTTSVSGEPCRYQPSFLYDNERLTVRGVTLTCPVAEGP
jgi:hypothetical protein